MADEGKPGSDPADQPADKPADRTEESPSTAAAAKPDAPAAKPDAPAATKPDAPAAAKPDAPAAAKPTAGASTSKPGLPATSGVRAAASDPLRELRRRLDNPFGVTAVAFLLGLLLFLPGLGSFGFWEPYETTIVDTVSAHSKGDDPGVASAHPMLQTRILVQAAKLLGLSEWALRLPLALLGALGMAAVAFAASWLWRPRSGIYAAIALGTSASFLFQARQLGGDVTSMTMTALVIAFLAPVIASAEERSKRPWLWLPLAAAAALGAHFSCGALIGVALPCAGAAAALLAGLLLRDAHNKRMIAATPANLAIAAGLAAVALFIGIWGYVDLVTAPRDAPRWSAILATTVQRGLDTQQGFDYVVQRIGFGFFPWSGVLIGGALWGFAVLGADGLGGPGPERSSGRGALGQVAILVWLITAYGVMSIWARKIGEVPFVALPACALVVGAFLGDVTGKQTRMRALPLIGLLALATTVILARDFHEFPQKLASAPFLREIAWPLDAAGKKAEPGLRVAVVGLGLLFAIVALAALVWRDEPGASGSPLGKLRNSIGRIIGVWGVPALAWVALLGSLTLDFTWTPRLSRHFSYRGVFDRYHALAGNHDTLAVMGVEERGVKFYAHGSTVERIEDMGGLLKFLKSDARRFAIIPSDRLGGMQQAATAEGVRYFVVDRSNARFWLLSNQVKDQTEDSNPLKAVVLRDAPADMAKYRPIGCDFEGKIELVGVKMPASVSKGKSFDVSYLFRVKSQVGGSWKVFTHFDGPGIRFHGDHDPVKGLYSTSYWTTGDYIIDTFKVSAGNFAFPSATFTVMMGFWPGGGAETRLRLMVPPTPPELDKRENRCLVGTIQVE